MIDQSEIRSKIDYLHQKFHKVAGSLTSEQLNQKIHEHTNGWTVIEILRHIAISELEIVDLMNQVKNGGKGVERNFDITQVNETYRNRDKDMGLQEVQDVMDRTYQLTISFLEKTSEKDWQKTGRYFTGDIMSVYRMFEILMWHQNHHLKQITEKIN